MQWPEKPFIYEINTWVWLNSLSRNHNRKITLDNVPDEEVERLASLNVDAIWMMGVWQRSLASQAIAHKYKWQYEPALPDVNGRDIAGSPYAIAAYEVDNDLGGREGLATFRDQLYQHHLRLVLDFVPNHVASDHHWVRDHPEYLINGTPEDFEEDPITFYAARDMKRQLRYIAHGRDPYFPAWADTAQINAFNPETRKAVVEVLLGIADQCDGVRCDMAMLLQNSIFTRTWGNWVGDPPGKEFWVEVIPQIKRYNRDFMFMAEVYWQLEWEMQQQGFDFTYDKMLYDRILESNVGALKAHLHGASIDFQQRMVRFIENHDEGRAYDSLGSAKSRPAATMITTLPGATLLHDGQFEGRRAKLPVQIGRQPDEPVDEGLMTFYESLLAETRQPIYQRGTWSLFDILPAWQGNESHHAIIAYGWVDPTWTSVKDYRLIIVNITDVHTQGVVNFHNWMELNLHDWYLIDIVGGQRIPRRGEHLAENGLYIEMPPYSSHIFTLEPCNTQIR